MRFFTHGFCAILLTAGVAAANDQIPGAPQSKPVAIVGATLHTNAGSPIESGTIVFENGRITAVGDAGVAVPTDADVIDGKGLRVYPGLFDAFSTVGLIEIDAVRATNDLAETGPFNPNVRAAVAVNPDSELIPTIRSNGILISNVTPGGGTILGTSSTMMLDGWTWEQMTLVPASGLVIRWPAMVAPRSWRSEESERQQFEARDRALRQLDDFFDAAIRYRSAVAADSATPFDARLDAMIPVLAGERPVIVIADELAQIESAAAFAKRHALKLIIAGGRDAMLAIDTIKRENIPVILRGTHQLPRSADDAIDAVFALPAQLKAAGVTFCIASSGRTSNARNLPFEAGVTLAYGLDADDAIKSITLWPARILGCDDRVGSLEVGKDATLIVTTGDVLETPTHVVDAYVQGRRIDLGDKHKSLYEKYRKRLNPTR